MDNRKVMIVDDDKEFLEELKSVMELSGYEPVVVNDAAAALEVASAVKPAVIVVDLKMPKKSGFKLADELRRLFSPGTVPVIAMSGFYEQDIDFIIRNCGIKRCLRKPFQPLDIIAELEDALSSTTRPAPAAAQRYDKDGKRTAEEETNNDALKTMQNGMRPINCSAEQSLWTAAGLRDARCGVAGNREHYLKSVL